MNDENKKDVSQRSLCHDLRTPLNAIMGYALMLEQGLADASKVASNARKITLVSKTMLEVINSAMQTENSREEFGECVDTSFSVTEMLSEVKASLLPQMDSKSMRLVLDFENTANVEWVRGSRVCLRRVLLNLLSNAIKYSPAGSCITMTAHLSVNIDDNLRFECTIEDNGCGISEDFLDRLYRPYERELGRIGNVQGSGLGMSIVRELVEDMDGNIRVRSSIGNGTTVEVGVPLKASRPQARTENEDLQKISTVNKGAFDGLCFLAAEDNSFNGEILKLVLVNLGAECTLCNSGENAVNAFMLSAKNEFDAILMDIHMKGMDGYQAAARIRECGHPDGADIPIIAMTADTGDDDIKRSIAAGMNGHVAKPIDLQVLIRTVKALI